MKLCRSVLCVDQNDRVNRRLVVFSCHCSDGSVMPVDLYYYVVPVSLPCLAMNCFTLYLIEKKLNTRKKQNFLPVLFAILLAFNNFVHNHLHCYSY